MISRRANAVSSHAGVHCRIVNIWKSLKGSFWGVWSCAKKLLSLQNFGSRKCNFFLCFWQKFKHGVSITPMKNCLWDVIVERMQAKEEEISRVLRRSTRKYVKPDDDGFDFPRRPSFFPSPLSRVVMSSGSCFKGANVYHAADGHWGRLVDLLLLGVPEVQCRDFIRGRKRKKNDPNQLLFKRRVSKRTTCLVWNGIFTRFESPCRRRHICWGPNDKEEGHTMSCALRGGDVSVIWTSSQVISKGILN